MLPTVPRELTGQVIGLAIGVHRWCGPALLERSYRACLVHDLREQGLHCETEVPMDCRYRGTAILLGYRLDLVVEHRLVVEIKTVERILPVHEAQVLSYLRLGGFRRGLLLNFRVPALRDGVRHFVHDPDGVARIE